MRKVPFLLIAIIFLFTVPSTAQKTNGCGYKIPPKSLRTNFSSVYEAADVVKNMLDSVKWKENFRIREQNGINNAYATIINQVRWIVYDNDFLENLDSYAATKWASISVLAHEIGHHYFNHMVKSQGSNIPSELEADKFSGYAMYRMGASLQQAMAAMEKIGTDRASSTHPAKADRLKAITDGWNMAMNQTTGSNNTNTPTTGNNNPVPVPGTNNGNTGAETPNTNTDPATDPSWIALYMQSNKTETVYLSDDGKNYQAAEIKAGEPFVFKFEIYNYGWLRLKYYNGYRVFKLTHGKDYNILWNRRTKNWTLVQVPE
ncbi:MAG: M48 family metalloprotease [Ferruginibacter sp.]